MATTQQPKYVTTADGRRITYERWKYEQTVAQEAAMRQVNDLITAEAAAAANVGAGFDQSEFGALLRSIVPQLLDQYGRVNATAALQFYDAQRAQWLETYGDSARQMAGRGNVRAQGTRYATARTQSALAVSQGYAAQYADDYRRAAKADSVINYAMRVRQSSGHAPSVTAMNNALTREVAMYHRDTVLFNAGLDPFVNRVQRVAQAKACEFCRLMALGSTNGTVRTSTYAVKFHSHCHCTIQPLFDGDQPVRPDYYDEFEKQYAEASKSGGSSQDILAKWRANNKAGAVAKIPRQLNTKTSFSAASSVTEVRDILRAKYPQVDFRGFSAAGIDLDNMKDFGKSLDNLMSAYPGNNLRRVSAVSTRASWLAAVSSQTEFRLARGAKGFSMTPDELLAAAKASNPDKFFASHLEVNLSYLKNRSKLEEVWHRSHDSGHFHGKPSDASAMDYTLTHEFGHVIDNTLRETVNARIWRTQFLKEAGYSNTVSKEAGEYFKSQISGYGATNSAELFAEAFVDATLNGSNAKTFSIYLLNLIKQRLGASS